MCTGSLCEAVARTVLRTLRRLSEVLAWLPESSILVGAGNAATRGDTVLARGLLQTQAQGRIAKPFGDHQVIGKPGLLAHLHSVVNLLCCLCAIRLYFVEPKLGKAKQRAQLLSVSLLIPKVSNCCSKQHKHCLQGMKIAPACATLTPLSVLRAGLQLLARLTSPPRTGTNSLLCAFARMVQQPLPTVVTVSRRKEPLIVCRSGAVWSGYVTGFAAVRLLAVVLSKS